MPRIFINNCSIEELMSVPGIGAKVADKILELREAKGDLELDDLKQVPYLRITQRLLDCLDFTSFESKEGNGSLYDLHRERGRSGDKLIGKWDGTGQGQVKERGKDMGTFDKVPSTGGSYSSYVWHSYLSPLTMIKAWFSRERIPRTNIRVSYMHVLHIRTIPLIAARIPIQIVPSRSTK
jgi:hypothetical protein